MTCVSLSSSEQYNSFDHALTACAVGFLFGPLVGIIALVVSELLSDLTQHQRSDNLPLDHRLWKELKEPWLQHGLAMAKSQLCIALILTMGNVRVNQMALQWVVQSLATPLRALLCFIRVCIIAPLAEELAFRGFLQDRLCDIQTLVIGAKAAASKIWTLMRVAIQAVAFALCHFHPAQGLSNIAILLVTGMFGLYCGLIKAKSGRVTYGIGLHNLINTSVVARVCLFGV